MMKITCLSHLFKWENMHNWWLTKYFFAPLYIVTVRTHSPLYDMVSIYFALLDTPVSNANANANDDQDEDQ